jgi:hypothetical protein
MSNNDFQTVTSKQSKISKLQQEIVNYIDGTKNNNCKINLCNKKIK